jgi:hypothetical protein
MEETVICQSCFKFLNAPLDIKRHTCPSCFKEIEARVLRNGPIPPACEECGKIDDRKALTLSRGTQNFIWLCLPCWKNHLVGQLAMA